MARRARLSGDDLNPYIGVTDTAMNLLLVMLFFVAALTAVGRVSWDDIRYKEAQEAFRKAVQRLVAQPQRPRINAEKNDPPGTQRWVFKESQLFKPGTAQLTPNGKVVLDKFALALKDNADKWRRIRVEGHTLPTPKGQLDQWEAATDRAAVVARYLVRQGIPPYFLATAGRGGQNPLPKLPLDSPLHARIEVVLEYAKNAAKAQVIDPAKGLK